MLTNEAIRYKSDGAVGPFIVIGNSISAQIFPDTELLIEYCNSEQQSLAHDQNDNEQMDADNSVRSFESIVFIKHALVRMLQRIHHKRLHVPAPAPHTAVMGLTDEMRIATVVPRCYKNLVADMENKERSLIEQTILWAKLHVVKRRIDAGIQLVQRSFPDKRFQINHETIACDFTAIVKLYVNDTTSDERCRANAQLTATPHLVRAHTEQATSEFAPDPHNITAFLLNIVCSHQHNCIRIIANSLGWKCQSVSPFSGIDISTGEHGSLLLTSIYVDCYVSIQYLCTVEKGISFEILVRHFVSHDMVENELASHFNSTTPVTVATNNPKAFIFNGFWQKVDCDRVAPGGTFAKKLERILVILNNKLSKLFN